MNGVPARFDTLLIINAKTIANKQASTSSIVLGFLIYISLSAAIEYIGPSAGKQVGISII